jgi:serine/threonine protein kinase
VKPEPFGQYTLFEWLAAGGMGEVFLAKAGRQGFERLFAVKRILAQHVDSEEFVRMLVNEARISVQLNHPNIAQVFEFGSIGRHFFLAMEYVEGLSLSTMIKRGRERGIKMPAADAVFIAMQVLRALHYAHTKTDPSGSPLKIVHRDVSPQNVLLDEAASVKLIDFGVARASENLVQTDASSVKGKIPYMSPEQAKGEAIDGRSDLYAVALVLYECLMYEPMFRSGNSLQTLKSVQTGEIQPLEPKLGTKIPPSLLGVLEKALKASADERFASAAEFERALAYVLHELEPGHTSQRLAELIAALDPERPARKKILQEALSTSQAHPSLDPEPQTQSEFRRGGSLVGDGEAGPRAPSWAEPSSAAPAPPAQVPVAVRPPVEQPPVAVVEPVRATTTPSIVLPPAPAARTGLVIGVAATAVLAVAMVALLRSTAEPTTSAMPAMPATSPMAQPTQRAVRIVSEPPGARVLVNGLWRGQAPVEIPDIPMDSPALIRLELDGHEPQETLLPPRALGPLELKLAPKAATADVAKSTKSASTTTTPRATSSSTTVGKATPAGDEKPRPAAAVDACVAVNVIPWAHVSEGGKKLGTTPLSCLRLPVGKHTLHLENPALGAAKDVDVDVVAGETARVAVRF